MFKTKIFLTWYVSPEDPRYWEFFPIPGLVVAIKSVLRLMRTNQLLFQRLISRGFKRVFSYNGFLVIDSLLKGFYKNDYDNLRDLAQNDILYLQYALDADILVHKDHPLVNIDDENLRLKMYRKNLILAELALKFSDKLGKEVMLVVHGWDAKSYAKCARYYTGLGAKYLGIGSLLALKNNVNTIVGIVRKIREEVGSKIWLHLFGVTSQLVLNRVNGIVNSVDASTPIRAAFNREIIIYDNGVLRRVKISSLHGYMILKEMLDKAKTKIEQKLIRGILSSQSFINQKKYLAVYNAYITLKAFDQL